MLALLDIGIYAFGLPLVLCILFYTLYRRGNIHSEIPKIKNNIDNNNDNDKNNNNNNNNNNSNDTKPTIKKQAFQPIENSPNTTNNNSSNNPSEINSDTIEGYFYHLYSLFKPKLFFWELVILLRKLSMVAVSLYLSQEPTYQTVLGLVVLVGFSIVQYFGKPYKLTKNNWLEFALNTRYPHIYIEIYNVDSFGPFTYIFLLSLYVDNNSLALILFTGLIFHVSDEKNHFITVISFGIFFLSVFAGLVMIGLQLIMLKSKPVAEKGDNAVIIPPVVEEKKAEELPIDNNNVPPEESIVEPSKQGIYKEKDMKRRERNTINQIVFLR